MKPRIALFLHQPKASVQSGNGIITALSSQYDFKIFTKHELERGFFKDIDCVAFPGGVGDSDSYDYLLQHHVKEITNFVKRGGKYLGICMGAYWADQDYFNLLEGARALQYIKQPGTDTRRPHAKAIDIKAVFSQNTCQSQTLGIILPIEAKPPTAPAPFLVKTNLN